MTHSRQWIGIGRTDIGRVRSSNQDTYAVMNECAVWFIADGMGGHVGGEIAAQTAMVIATTEVKKRIVQLHDHPDQIPDILTDIVSIANRAIHDKAQQDLQLKGMGTTFLALAISPAPSSIAYIAHLGDSRAYLYRDGSLTQLTQDHTLVELLVRRGLITAETARTFPERHVLIKALGMGIELKPEVTSSPLHQDDLVLLCTDGLTKMMDDSAIAAILSNCHGDPDHASYELITQAVARGGEDNVTVIVCGLVDASRQEHNH